MGSDELVECGDVRGVEGGMPELPLPGEGVEGGVVRAGGGRRL